MPNPYLRSCTILRAMAHPTRLRLLQELDGYEACVCHLTALVRKPQAHVSQHLIELRRSGLVKIRKQGLRVYYRLADPRVQATLRALRLESTALGPTAVRGCRCPSCAANAAALHEHSARSNRRPVSLQRLAARFGKGENHAQN